MRILLLIVTISAATQLPARDVPLRPDGATPILEAPQPCGDGQSKAAPFVLSGLTPFAPAGPIA